MTGAPVFDQVFSEPDANPKTLPGFLLMYNGQKSPPSALGFPQNPPINLRALSSHGAAFDQAMESAAEPRRDAAHDWLDQLNSNRRFQYEDRS